MTVDLTLPAWITDRAGWGARPPARPCTSQTLPTPRLWLHHSVTPAGGADWMRRIQSDHLGRGWRDIAYTFAVSASGEVFEGIGVQYRHLNSDGAGSATVLLIGNHDTTAMPAAMVEATARLVAHGVLAGWWSSDLTGGHRDIPGQQTACPGRYAHAQIPRINAQARQIILDIQEANAMAEVTQAVGYDSKGHWYRFDGAVAIPIHGEAGLFLTEFLGVERLPTALVDAALDARIGWCRVVHR